MVLAFADFHNLKLTIFFNKFLFVLEDGPFFEVGFGDSGVAIAVSLLLLLKVGSLVVFAILFLIVDIASAARMAFVYFIRADRLQEVVAIDAHDIINYKAEERPPI